VSGPNGRAKLDPKVVGVLACLATARGDLVTRDRLMTEVWPGVIVTDFALSRCIYQIRRTLRRASARNTSPVETLPRRGYRLAWEVRPGVPGSGAALPPTRPGKNGRMVAVGMAVAAVAAVLVLKGPTHGPGDAPERETMRVAVLPLDNLSGDRSQATFANGLTREIIHAVAAIPGVVAVGRTSVFGALTAGWQPLDTGQRLEANFVISGSLGSVGSARRVLVDLRSVPEGEVLWSHSYLIDDDAPFVLLAELAGSVAEALDVSTARRARGGIRNLAALEAYFAADEAGTREARRQLLLRAVDLDPDFALAWTRLASIEVMPVWNGEESAEAAWERARPFLDRAFEIDPGLPLAHVTLGRFQRTLGDMDGAIESFRHALDLDPGFAWASANLGLVLRWTGRYEEALMIHEAAVRMDPLSAAAHTRLGTSHWFMGDFDQAERHYRTAIDLDPAYEEVYDSWAGMLGAGLGRFDAALEMIERKMSVPGEPTVRTLATAGRLCSILGMDAAAWEYWSRGREINASYPAIDEDLLLHYLERGEDQAAREMALGILGPAAANSLAQLALAILDLENGDRDAFARRIREAYPPYFDTPPVIDVSDPRGALLVALAHEVDGREEEKQRVLDAIYQAFPRPKAWQYMTLAAAHAIGNEPEAALQSLESSPPGRVRVWAPLLMRDPRFASLRDLERFRVLVANHVEELRLQHSRAEVRLATQASRPGKSPPRD
ncbi:MAG TPA: tetratricopeptide repeat protein, partial [Gemmatimonadales bacterium]|nr:tetratricopeptide repeat protein [Gemmatimonadales bacterium]